MKKFYVLTAIILALAFIGAGCSKGDTELAWKNGSAAAINDISWASGDQTWSITDGYNTSATTESKTVNALNGEVDCMIDDGGFVNATVNTINGSPAGALSLNEGESYVYTISASPTK